MRDFGLWDFVKRTITPLGQPVRKEPPREMIRRDDVFDLHGRTLAQGFAETVRVVRDAREGNLKEITIITGRSGEMRRELPHWLEDHPDVRAVVLSETGGAYVVKIKKNKR